MAENNERSRIQGWRKYSAMVIGILAIVIPPLVIEVKTETYDILVSGVWKLAGVYMLGNGVSAIAGAFTRK
jgi:hypothetical protein